MSGSNNYLPFSKLLQNVLLVQAESLAEKYTMFASNELHATYHLGDDRNWHNGNDANLEYE